MPATNAVVISVDRPKTSRHLLQKFWQLFVNRLYFPIPRITSSAVLQSSYIDFHTVPLGIKLVGGRVHAFLVIAATLCPASFVISKVMGGEEVPSSLTSKNQCIKLQLTETSYNFLVCNSFTGMMF